jgi:phosphoserine phosphatase RsbU/P
MAVTHAIAHNLPGPPQPPSELLSQLNRRLHAHYTADGGSFVTAFYGMYDPNTRRLEYASAGHNPPRLCTGSGVVALDAVGGLPLGIDPEHVFEESEITLKPGDRLVLYTDGITEARAPGGELFGESRLDGVLCRGHATADEFVSALVANVDEFCAGRAQEDDRTLLACWLDGGVTDRPGPGAGGRR